MCGIAGILNANYEHKGATQRMITSINHRGPDDSDVLEDFDRKICLGSARLSIIDLSPKGRMPMTNQKKTVVVCQNGEIYNYKELRRELTELGYSFQSESDTEVILHGYSQWGEKIFEKLNGMYAIAVYDYVTQTALLARDRIGIKPLYYLTDSGTLFFSSEVKAFKNIKDYSLKNDLDYSKLKLALGFMFLPDQTSTLFNKVKKIEPGTYLKWEGNENKLTYCKYWSLTCLASNTSISFPDALEKLDKMLVASVREHMVADVPVGIMLSGGLDSSLIAAYAQKSSAKKIKTFTASFDHKLNESKNAEQVSQYLRTEHHEIFVDTKNVIEDIEKYASIYDDLGTFDGGVISSSIIATKLKEHGVTVVLLGEGADEIFGGYSWFGLSKYPFSFLPPGLRSFAYYYAISRNVSFNTIKYVSYWNDLIRAQRQKDVFREISATEVNVQLPNHLLMKVDKSTMSASVEARVPYLDHRIVENIFSLSQEYKIKGKFFNIKQPNEKYILREIAKKYLPVETANRKKRGFMLPMFEVLTSDLGKVESYVLAKDALTSTIISREYARSLLDLSCPQPLRMQREYLLWRLFLIEVWYKCL